MANYATLKAAIQEVIKTNGNNEITGVILQQSLLAMINSLGAGYQFVGIATPSTEPGTPDYNVFYFAGPGTYPNFNNATIPARNVGLLSYNGTWHVSSVQTTPFSAQSIAVGIIQLYDGETPVYPRTKAEAVFFDDDTTKTLDQQFSQLGQEIHGEWEYRPLVLDLTSGYYYNQYLGKIADNLGERADTSCSRVNASHGEKFKIYGRGTAAIHLYAFTDSSLNVLLTNTESVNSRSEGLEITAPANSAFLFINFLTYDSTTDKLEKYEVIQDGLENRVDELEEDLEQIALQKVNKNDIVNDLISGGTTKVLSAEQGKILNEQLNGTTTIQTLTGIEDGKYYNMNNNVVIPADVPSGVTYTCSRISADCVSGDKFKVYGYGRNYIFNLYAFTDSNNHIIEASTYPIDTRAEGLVITCPPGATKLYCNFYNYDSSTDKLQKIVVERGIQQELEELENYIDKQPLKNKKILAFGDSITEFKWSVSSGGDGKGWVDHASEILGCVFVNAAIGGSHMGSRFIGHIELFDSTHQYGTDDYVFYKPSNTMNLYKCINAHSGSWDANDFEDVSENQSLIGTVAYAPIFVYSMIHAFCNTSVADAEERFRDQIAAAECIYTWKSSHDDNRAIVQTLVSTDPSEIDAIIIAEGTNDYAAADYRGTSGSFDVTTCLGGINQALKEIGETFKKIATFYVTPPVRWWNWADGSGQLSDFSDNYKANGESDITLREWVEILKNEYHLRHIPTCDLYNELGWNQWNFANYFPANDGTHPRPGFKNIGAKVASFLVAHNVIK